MHQKKPRLRDRTDRAWFGCLLRHPARKWSGYILTTPEPARGSTVWSTTAQSNICISDGQSKHLQDTSEFRTLFGNFQHLDGNSGFFGHEICKQISGLFQQHGNGPIKMHHCRVNEWQNCDAETPSLCVGCSNSACHPSGVGWSLAVYVNRLRRGLVHLPAHDQSALTLTRLALFTYWLTKLCKGRADNSNKISIAR